MNTDTTTNSESTEPKPTTGQELKHEFIEFVKMIVWFLIIFGVLKAFVIEGYEVLGDSMAPTLQDQERIFVFKLPHILSETPFFDGYEPFEPGDIVVFDSTTDSTKRYVKRVIACGPHGPGSNTVEAGGHQEDAGIEPRISVLIKNGSVYVNNKRVYEHYLPEHVQDKKEEYYADLERDQYFVLGDNRNVSKDSRSFGPVKDDFIIGEAVFRFWPPSKFGPL